MARELVEALKREIAETESRLTWLRETLRRESGMRSVAPSDVLTSEGKLIRPPVTTAKAADAIERLLEGGQKTMKRAALIKIMADQGLVLGQTEARRYQYAELAVVKGLEGKYLKEDRDGTIHWVPGVRNSRVSKKR